MITEVERQKQQANRYLSTLERLDPEALVAGGAPRDWWFDRTAKDLDVFIYLGKMNKKPEYWKSALEAVGLKVKEVKSSSKEYPIKAYRDPNAVSFLDEPINWFKFSVTSLIQKCKTADDYVDAKNQYLEAVIDLEVEPGETPVQVMIMNQPVHVSTYSTFPVSLSMIWYKHNRMNPTKDFMVSEKHQIMYVTGEDKSLDKRYTRKVREKFPEFEYLDSKEKVIQFLSDKVPSTPPRQNNLF